MAQVIDRTVGANPSGFDMRTELNNIISALESDNSGSSEPLNPVPYMKWLDTSDATYYYYKERNHDNTAWVTLFRYMVATKIMEVVSNGVVLQDSALVHKTGDETIAGVKTFSSSPIVPTPTTGTQAVNKDYADLKVALADFTGANQSLASSGYQKLPGGLILQWGEIAGTTAGVSVTYPIAFPNVVLKNMVSNRSGASNTNVASSSVGTNTGFTAYTSVGTISVTWFAIGY